MIGRQIVIRRAMLKYGDSVNKNITEAMKLYLANDATEEEQVPLFITKRPEVKALETIFKKEGSPRCEECNGEMKVREKVKKGNKIYETAWFCKCGIIEYSDNTIAEWAEILKNENRG